MPRDSPPAAESKCSPDTPAILVADDDVKVRNLVALMLQQEGYFVLQAADGHEGLELSRKYGKRIDMLVTDVEMPRMNGMDLCGHLLEERPGIKVLIISGKTLEDIAGPNTEHPFLAKPFGTTVLLNKVREVLAAAPVQLPARV